MLTLQQELLNWAELLNEGSDAHRILIAAVRRLSYYEEGLKIIAGELRCIDNLMGNQDVAKEALKLAAEIKWTSS